MPNKYIYSNGNFVAMQTMNKNQNIFETVIKCAKHKMQLAREWGTMHCTTHLNFGHDLIAHQTKTKMIVVTNVNNNNKMNLINRMYSIILRSMWNENVFNLHKICWVCFALEN